MKTTSSPKRPVKHTVLYILFALTAALILANRYTNLYINNSVVHFILLFIAAASFVVIIGHFFGKLKSDRSIIFTFMVIGVVCFLKYFLTWGGDWKTQTVVYKCINNDRRTIEYQMRGDRFSFGYKKRVINRLKIVPFIDWTTDIDTLGLDTAQWKRVNEKVNELGLIDQ